MNDRKPSFAPSSLKSLDPVNDLNHASLLAEQVRAIVDLVAHAEREEMYETTISTAMHLVMGHAEKIQDLVGGVFPYVNSGKRMEVVNG